MKRVVFDFETRSLSELKKQGGYKYSLHPTTRATCMAFKERQNPKVHLLKFEEINRLWKELPGWFTYLWQLYIGEGYLFAAHNVFFDMCIYKNVLVARFGWPDIPFGQFRCTAAKAAACALPRGLEGVGEALNLTIQKDKTGYIAMMQTCKPTKAWNAWKKKIEQGKANDGDQPPVFLEPHHAPDTWKNLYHYCKVDVATEELLDMALPDLTPSEQEIWFLNQRLNWRGLKIDVPTVKKIVGIMSAEEKIKRKELDRVTTGLVTKPGALKSILEFLDMEGVKLPNLRAKTVDDALKEINLSPDTRKLLEIRKALSKASTKKYQGMLDRVGRDDRVRDILLYHGASTGRDTGTGIQPHNYPRGAIYVDSGRPYAAIENVIECDTELLKILYGDNLSILFSSILRNTIMPSEGCELYVADFSKIEVAVLWWLAGNAPGIKILREGKDPYKYQAAMNTGRKYEDIGDDDPARQLGKAQILGCGFGMGREKFKTTAFDMYRLKLTEAQAKQAVDNYRTANAAVPELWKNYEVAATAAIEEKGRVFKTGKCVFKVEDRFLWVTLPSGRKLAYLEPRLGWRETDYGPRKTIEFLGLDKSKKKMVPERTWGGTLTENCLGQKTLILTDKGAKCISEITLQDQIFDGFEFVSHGGLICQGEKETGNWLNIRVTGNHLINDGTSWRSVMFMDVPTTQNALNWGRSLAHLWLRNQTPENMQNQNAGAIAALKSMYPQDPYFVGAPPVVAYAGTKKRELYAQNNAGTEKYFLPINFLTYGRIAIREWYRGVTTKIMRPIRIMVDAEYGYFLRGGKTEKSFLNTQKLLKTGAISRLIWTASITIRAIFREILDALLEAPTLRIGAIPDLLTSGGKKLLFYPFGNLSAQNGEAIIRYTPILNGEKLRSRLWRSTGEKEKVYDLLNCGPRQQFMILTSEGPIIAHNCVQATARDLMMPAMLRLETAKYTPLLMVHDEGICEKEIGKGDLDEFIKILCKRPAWGDENLIIDAKGWKGPRYRK